MNTRRRKKWNFRIVRITRSVTNLNQPHFHPPKTEGVAPTYPNGSTEENRDTIKIQHDINVKN